MLAKPTVVFHCSARLDVSFKLLFLPVTFSGLSLEKDITVPSMAGLTRSVVLHGFSLARSDARQLRIDANVTFHNPSPIAVVVGDLLLTYEFGGAQMGQIKILDGSIATGRNHVKIQGTFEPAKEPPALVAAAAMCEKYLSGGAIPVMARVAENCTSSPFFREVLSGLVFGNVSVLPHAKPMVQRVDFGGASRCPA